jgi:hypothetical protein
MGTPRIAQYRELIRSRWTDKDVVAIPPIYMPLHDNDLEDFTEFVQVVEQLQRSRFGQKVLKQTKITLRMQGDGTGIEIVNFEEEDCEAFLLRCRLLIQNNERISIYRIWAIFEEKLGIEEFARINPPRWMLNDYLDRESPFAAPGEGSITNRLLLDTFLYGSYAHLNREHRKRFLLWAENPVQFHVLKFQFLMSLKNVLSMAEKMADAVKDFLRLQGEQLSR